MVTIINLTVVNAKNPYWRMIQNVLWNDHRDLEILSETAEGLPAIESPDVDFSTLTCAFDPGSLVWMTSAIFVMPSHNSHGSLALPPMPLPRIISDII